MEFGCWLRAYPSSVEVDCGCIASVALYWLREEFGTPSGLEILHGGEGGDVELGDRTSKHIIVFAFDPISLNPLSSICAKHHSFIISYLLVLPCIISYCLSSLYAWLVCVCLTCT